jgi:CheY-like chemotaxis protein
VPTVLLVDLDLPDMSGYDVARHLSQHPRLQNLRLIALTANRAHPGRELAREAGIERYLIKPVGAAALDELFTWSSDPRRDPLHTLPTLRTFHVAACQPVPVWLGRFTIRFAFGIGTSSRMK